MTVNEQEIRVSFTKFDRNIPDDFLQARENEINEYINRLNRDISTQEHLDKAYADFVVFVKDEMIQKLNHRQINAVVGYINKKRKLKKPWWNDQLTELKPV